MRWYGDFRKRKWHEGQILTECYFRHPVCSWVKLPGKQVLRSWLKTEQSRSLVCCCFAEEKVHEILIQQRQIRRAVLFYKEVSVPALVSLVFVQGFVGHVGGGWRWWHLRLPLVNTAGTIVTSSPASTGPQANSIPNARILEIRSKPSQSSPSEQNLSFCNLVFILISLQPFFGCKSY